METFDDFTISKQLQYAIADLGYEKPTPIQVEAFPVIRSGRDVVGIAQTGTGKTFAYMLPILQDLKFSKEIHPRVLILVPTRELAIQTTEEIEKFGKYLNIRVQAIYGGVNMNMQKQMVVQGTDIIVATPGRLYDLVLSRALQLKNIKKLVIDEVDIMLDLGFRFQLTNLFELIPVKRQHILFSATMTEEVDTLIQQFFRNAETITIAVSGTPLANIEQRTYSVPNFYTKVNLLRHLLVDESMEKVLIFVANKRNTDRVYSELESDFMGDIAVIHSNKSQNYRIRAIDNFNAGSVRILVSTDIMSRGLDLDKISHVINMDTPRFAENYMHRIGRTGRAEQEGHAILFYTDREVSFKEDIEALMGMKIPELPFPESVEISKRLLPSEEPVDPNAVDDRQIERNPTKNAGFHEKSLKNQKINLGGSYKRKIEKKYKKPKTRGDKNYNKRNKK
ncbi:DEAD/DEAH box helicase [Flavobacteriaceae bacterium F08102]|nr:DEAD/DEAH box helicase [Flavobacteriaceae bacterium F08102]